jgi:hypothetical protein
MSSTVEVVPSLQAGGRVGQLQQGLGRLRGLVQGGLGGCEQGSGARRERTL